MFGTEIQMQKILFFLKYQPLVLALHLKLCLPQNRMAVAVQNGQPTSNLLTFRAKKPNYHAAQLSSGKKFLDFWVSIFEHFFRLWPLPELTEEEKLAGETDIRKAKVLKLVSKCFTVINI